VLLKHRHMASYTVSKNKKTKEWDVKRDRAKRISTSASTQKEAEKLAKQFSANNGGGEVRVKGRNGKYRDPDTVKPGNDPNPPRDKKH